MPGPDDNSVSLEAVCAKNKLTLLFFWRSNCSHCKEFKPVLAALYEKYHPLGLEVLALSLDKSDIGWKETLQREPTKWVNAFVPLAQRQAINEQFPIPSTPTLIALDSKCTVVSRLILREQLAVYLGEKLGQ
jgi:thiol-disulfide isomerase/thioredoxin